MAEDGSPDGKRWPLPIYHRSISGVTSLSTPLRQDELSVLTLTQLYRRSALYLFIITHGIILIKPVVLSRTKATTRISMKRFFLHFKTSFDIFPTTGQQVAVLTMIWIFTTKLSFSHSTKKKKINRRHPWKFGPCFKFNLVCSNELLPSVKYKSTFYKQKSTSTLQLIVFAEIHYHFELNA